MQIVLRVSLTTSKGILIEEDQLAQEIRAVIAQHPVMAERPLADLAINYDIVSDIFGQLLQIVNQTTDDAVLEQVMALVEEVNTMMNQVFPPDPPE